MKITNKPVKSHNQVPFLCVEKFLIFLSAFYIYKKLYFFNAKQRDDVYEQQSIK